MSNLPEEIAAHVARAAEELAAAAGKIPACDCEHMDPERMSKVVADVGSAERAAAEVHRAFRQLEKQHGGGALGLATLETQSLEGCTDCVAPVTDKVDLSINQLAEQASAEATGGQCC
ncbi:Transcriptional family [Chlorella sorokiniana]|jgi:hypothetical protein|uniref:Transcriptional family n=1 Tax=Chlorella sorokiniana TaxID=3076 RepID=A0A2P6U0W8_CHLSO|nr:Transcriptional family [Chlorella sorokiniana]|eukprot:PRW59957.1 Transcriptional family [Chlorella sorokiniana]